MAKSNKLPDEVKLVYARNKGRLYGAEVDLRSPYPRRCRDLMVEHINDLGGEENTSVAERSILRRIATITVELEIIEGKFVLANGASATELQLYLSASNTLRRLLESVGLQRRAKLVNAPTLNEIAKQQLDVGVVERVDAVVEQYVDEVDAE
jgi:hypothetical protein